jgi:hypothetical protein
LSLAGVLKNNSLTIIFVHRFILASLISHFSHQITSKEYPDKLSQVFEIIVNLETDEIDANASHLNQKVIILCKSSKFLIFEVVCFSVSIFKSSFSIQFQLSLIIISLIHHNFISTFIDVLPASILFSTSSFTTETGLSTTSQADI